MKDALNCDPAIQPIATCSSFTSQTPVVSDAEGGLDKSTGKPSVSDMVEDGEVTQVSSKRLKKNKESHEEGVERRHQELMANQRKFIDLMEKLIDKL